MSKKLLGILSGLVAKWPNTSERADGDEIKFNGERVGHWVWVDGEVGAVVRSGGRIISKEQWVQHREELINEPSRGSAPEWANWKAQDRGGEWHWFEREPMPLGDGRWGYLTPSLSDKREFASDGYVLGGRDWKETLRASGNNWYYPEEHQWQLLSKNNEGEKSQELKDAITFTAALIDSLGQDSAASEVLSNHLDKMMQHYSKGAICGK